MNGKDEKQLFWFYWVLIMLMIIVYRIVTGR